MKTTFLSLLLWATLTAAGLGAAAAPWRVTVGGRVADVAQIADVCYVRFPVTGPTAVEFAADKPISTAILSPTASAPATRPSTGGKSVEIDRPRHLVVTAPGLPRLFLFAEPPETGAPRPGDASVLNVLDYGVDATGTALQTAKLQQALDEASARHATLYFPAGTYLSGTLQVKSHTTVYLAAGARLQGSSQRADYPPWPGRAEAGDGNNGENFSFTQLILVNRAEDVRIAGRGEIRGGGAAVRNQGGRARVLCIRDSRTVQVEDVMLNDASAWNTHVLYSEDISFRRVKLLNDRTVGNTDGIDPDSSRRVRIEGGFFYCSDDCVAIKSTHNGGLLRDVEDIVVRDCVMLTKKSAMKLGTETKAAFQRDVRFENNDVIEADRFFTLYCYDGATFERVQFINNRLESTFPDSKRCAFHFQIKRRSGAGHMRDILVQDCVLSVRPPQESELAGLDAEHAISGVRFENLTVAGKVVTSAAEAGIRTNGFVSGVTFAGGK